MADERPVQGFAWDMGFHVFKSDGTVIADPSGLAARIVNSVHPAGADADNAPTVVDDVGGACNLRLSATEMTARVQVLVTATDAGAVPLSVTLYPDPNAALTTTSVGAAVWDTAIAHDNAETWGELLLEMDEEVDTAASATERGAYRGSVWLDTENGVDPAGSVDESWVGVYGIPTAPVKTLAVANAIASYLNLKSLNFTADSSITLSADTRDWTITGRGSVDLGGQDISDSLFSGCYVTGTSSGDGSEFQQCVLTDVSAGPFVAYLCGMNGTFTAIAPGNYTFLHSFKWLPITGTPAFDFGALAGVYAGFRSHSGAIELRNLSSGDSCTIEGRGRITIASTCSGGSLAIRGEWDVTDNVSGGYAGTLTDDPRLEVEHIADTVWAASTRTLSGSSSGAAAWEYTLTSAVDAAPIVGADVWVTTDSDGAHVVASGTTNALGKVTFYLIPATYYVWRFKSGYSFVNPDSEVIP